MPSPHWEKLKEIFHAAVALAPEARSAYLDRACDGNESLRQAVESLIKSHQETGFVDQPAYEAAGEMLLADERLTAGQTVGRYRILSLLGQGGMGEVYLAEDTKLHRRVAIKFLPADSSANEQANRRLLREAQAAAKLDHPNICAVHEVAEENGRGFIVMPYVEGETLDIRLKRKPFEVPESLAIAAQVADALAEAHAHGIIHRDIKPSNIIITARGQARVMDFGLAKAASARVATGIDAEASTQAMLTTPGTIIGTVPYMSPEQVHGQPLDARTDIFSFGILLYEILTGQQLFAAETPAGTISAILTKEPAPLSDYFKTCPQKLQRVVSKCLEKDRERRYQTMREVVTDLENVRRECESGALAISTSDNAAATFSAAMTDDVSERSSFLKSHLRLTLLVVGMLVTAASVYALFFRSSRAVPTGSVTSVDSAAYDYYLRGKLKATSENREQNESAIKILEDVIEQNPSFAPAYAELARAYGIKANYFAPEAEQEKLNEDARVYVEKALALEPNLAEGHFVRGFLLWTHGNRFPHEQAIQSDKRAIVLDPNLGQAHHHLGVMYFHIGMLDKGEEHLKQALAINPSDTLARFRLGSINVCRGKYDEALNVLKTVPREANAAIVDRATADALLHLGRIQEASDIVENYLTKNSTDEGGNVTSVKAILLAKAGKQREAGAMIQRAIEIGKGFQHFHHTTYNIAAAYALMNKPDEALKWLQFTADDGFPCYPLFEQDASLNNIRNDERFITFMAKQRQQWEKYKASL
jgi:serine/threonine protein kinase